jgi:hypothetical protein
MYGSIFDRIANALTASGARRQTLRGLLAATTSVLAALAVAGAEAKKKRRRRKRKKKKCRELKDACTGLNSCCNAGDGFVACREHSKPVCAGILEGPRCCALENALCDPDSSHCDCCDNLVCSPGQFFHHCRKPT